MEGLKDKRIELPGIKADKTLPVVLSKQEVKRLLLAPKLLKQIKVIVDLVCVKLGRQTVEVQGQFGQVAGVVGKRALASAGDGDFLSELLVKLAESCYISTGSLDEGLLFFFIFILALNVNQ